MKQTARILLLLAAVSAFCFQPCRAAAPNGGSRGQTIYVPVYSHIYSGDRERPFNLTATMSIRNTDPANPITVLSVAYYNSEGKVISEYLSGDKQLPPLAAIRFVVKESDTRGGSGASFLIRWKAEKRVSPPIAEAIMISTRSQQGVSFTSRGKVVEEL